MRVKFGEATDDIIARKTGDDELRETEVRAHPECPLNQAGKECMPSYIVICNVHHDFQLCRIYIDHIDISACTCLRCGLQHLETWWLGSCDDLRVIAYTDSLTLKAMVQYLCLNEDLVTDQHETSLNYLYEACDESSSSSSSSHKKAWRGMQYLHKMIICIKYTAH